MELVWLEMELEQSGSFNPAMTFDEVSMERSKSFVKALQVFLLTLVDLKSFHFWLIGLFVVRGAFMDCLIEFRYSVFLFLVELC